jgi:tripartite-type tricarboxylate transporter receptor subunit TctC
MIIVERLAVCQYEGLEARNTNHHRSQAPKETSMFANRYHLAVISASLLAALCAAPQALLAQAWPAKPVRMIVPYGPGGSTDISARVISEAVARQIGQSVIVENRPSAGGILGMEHVARAAADGYTQIVTADSALYLPTIRKDLTWDIKNFAPITQLVNQPILIAAHPDLGISSVADLVKLARSRPGDVTYGTGSASGTHTLAALLFAEAAGINLRQIPYKSGAQAATDLAGGHINIAFLGTGPLVSLYRSGKVRLIAVTGRERSTTLKDVPTVAESGYANFDVTQWFGLFAPAGTQPSIIGRMQSEVSRAMAQPPVRDKLVQSALDPVGNTAQEFAARIASEAKLWPRAVKELGMPVDG